MCPTPIPTNAKTLRGPRRADSTPRRNVVSDRSPGCGASGMLTPWYWLPTVAVTSAPTRSLRLTKVLIPALAVALSAPSDTSGRTTLSPRPPSAWTSIPLCAPAGAATPNCAATQTSSAARPHSLLIDPSHPSCLRPARRQEVDEHHQQH